MKHSNVLSCKLLCVFFSNVSTVKKQELSLADTVQSLWYAPVYALSSCICRSWRFETSSQIRAAEKASHSGL